MNTKDFLRMGIPLGQATRLATDFVAKFILSGGDKSRLHEEVAAIVANPSAFLADDLRKDLPRRCSLRHHHRAPSRCNIISGAKGWITKR